MKKAVIITGASKGLGLALAEKYSGVDLYLFARSKINSDVHYKKEIDLSDLEKTKAEFSSIFKSIGETKKYSEIILLNNAALIDPVGYSGTQNSDVLIQSLNVGFTSVLLITNLFIEHFQNINAKKKIMTISSGAALNAYPGWSHYCATKAGINMFTQTVFEEQKERKFPIEICAFRPGVMDTNMQEIIRNQPKENFPIVDKFLTLRNDSLLRDTSDVAKIIYQILSDETKLNPFYNVNDFD